MRLTRSNPPKSVLLEQAGIPREGKCQFVGRNDELSFDDWRNESSESTQSADAAEFGLLAHKRWQYYRKQALISDSANDLQTRIRQDPKVEVGMMCLIRPGWDYSIPVLGIAFFRRTWAGNFCIDFLTAHPAIHGQLRGVGLGLLEFIIDVAAKTKARSIWGETTRESVGFYENVFDRDRFGDRFSLPKSRFNWFQSRLFDQRLAKFSRG